MRRQIAEDRLAVAKANRFRNYLNDNLKQSRKRSLGVTSPGSPERDLSNMDRRKAMAMARQKVEENPLLASLLRAKLNMVVGEGFTLMMRSGDRGYDKAVEQWWWRTANTIDIRGMKRFGRLQRCWEARATVDGDLGIALIPYAFEDEERSYVQTIEADRIHKGNDPGGDGYDVDEYGRPTKFYVSTRDEKNPAVATFDAKDFILYMHDHTERAERMRGVSDLLVVFNLAADYCDIQEGIVQKVKNESFWGLKFTMKPADEAGTIFGDAQETGAGENGTDYSKVKVLPGSNVVLGANEDVAPIESSAPHAEFDEFEKKIFARIAAAAFGLSYHMGAIDYAEMNYTSSRAMREQILKQVRVDQAELGSVSSRVFQWALEREIKYGKDLKPPKSIESTRWQHLWGAPGFGHLNPQQEAQAQEILLNNKLTSRRIIIAERDGADVEDVFADLGDEEELMKEEGLTAAPVVKQPAMPPPLPKEKDDGNQDE